MDWLFNSPSPHAEQVHGRAVAAELERVRQEMQRMEAVKGELDGLTSRVAPPHPVGMCVMHESATDVNPPQI